MKPSSADLAMLHELAERQSGRNLGVSPEPRKLISDLAAENARLELELGKLREAVKLRPMSEAPRDGRYVRAFMVDGYNGPLGRQIRWTLKEGTKTKWGWVLDGFKSSCIYGDAVFMSWYDPAALAKVLR